MRIEFKRVPFQEKPFELTHEEEGHTLRFFGQFVKESPSVVMIIARMEGELSVVSDLTGEQYYETIREEIKFKIHDGPYRGFDKDYDIIESFDGFVDFDEIFAMEIEAIRSDYHA